MTDTPNFRPVTGTGRTGTGHRQRRRVLASTTIAVVLAAAAVLGLVYQFGGSLTDPFGHRDANATTVDAESDTIATATVTRRSLSAQTTEDATLGYAKRYTVTNQLAGSTGSSAGPAGGGTGSGAGSSAPPGAGSGQAVVTKLPKAGQVIEQGQVLYSVDGQPVVLLYGSTPAYRTLAEGAVASDVTGQDVRQLNADLVALGYASRSDLDPSSDEFSWATKAAVEKLQNHLGVDQTGRLELGSVVFLPTAVRVTTVVATLGATITRGASVLTGTSTTRQVTVELDTSKQSDIKVGDKVSITLPNNQTTPGVVTEIGTVAAAPSGSGGQPAGSGGSASGSNGGSSDSSDTAAIEVDVRLTHPEQARAWDQAPVQVTITTDTVKDALVVPVVALLAQSTSGYAVEVVAADGTRHLQPVSLGLFDDSNGLVQITGSGLAAGQRVVVPKL